MSRGSVCDIPHLLILAIKPRKLTPLQLWIYFLQTDKDILFVVVGSELSIQLLSSDYGIAKPEIMNILF